ncbi:hypothetical protein G7Y79_00024g056050 [Physcia stellaris]|nr:hypothetical protein G7Y79_00024g056050 [Physcia stellaris]
MAQPSLLSMPLELRNQIYSYIYDNKYATPLTREDGSHLLWSQLFGEPIPLTLLLVNRQISAEAATIFYSKTIFKGTIAQISSFVKGIGAAKANLLRQIDICHWEASPKPDFFRQLLPLKNLRVLRVVQPCNDPSCKGDIEAFKQALADTEIVQPSSRIEIELCIMWTNRRADARFHPVNMSVWNCKKGEAEWKEERRLISTFTAFMVLVSYIE